MNKKKKILSIFTIALIVVSLFSVPRTSYAATGRIWGGNFFSGLVQYLSQKFGLEKTQVQSAIQDYQKQKKANTTPRPTMTPQQREAAEKKRFDILVSQGKITTAQETAILNELTTIMAKYKFDSSLTPDQRKTQMTNMQNELKSWAQSNGIDPTLLSSFGPRGRFGGVNRGNK